MNDQWKAFLSAAAAGADTCAATPPWPAAREPAPALRAAVLCDLSAYDLLAFEGPDAEAFLQGQLSSDVQGLSAERCQLATYNSAKGRVLATMLLWRDADAFLAQLPAVVAEGIRKRLSMFILRAKVRATLVSDRFIRLGLGGPGAAAVLERAGIAYPAVDFGLCRTQVSTHSEKTTGVDFLLRLPGPRFELVVRDADVAIALWQKLAACGASPRPAAAWQWLAVRSGVAEIVTETQDQFVPQMLNLELIGGAISFTKGCYPGQEIVARTQYRGEVKRRTFLAHADAVRELRVGEQIFNADAPEQAVGSVVMAAPSPDGGTDLLACLHVDLARHSALRLGRPDGPAVHPLELPYKLPHFG